MEKKETAQSMAVLKAAYPRFYADFDKDEFMSTVNLWHSMLKDKDFETVSAAVKACIAVSKFPPTIADIYECMSEITLPKQKTAFEAWELVKKAVRNSLYNSEEEFKKLPEDVREIVGSASSLRVWGMENESVFDSVIGSNFQKSYNARQHGKKRMALMPKEITAFAEKQWELLAEKNED